MQSADTLKSEQAECMGAHRLPPEGLYEGRRHKQAQEGADVEAAKHVGGGAGALAGVHQARQHVGGRGGLPRPRPGPRLPGTGTALQTHAHAS